MRMRAALVAVMVAVAGGVVQAQTAKPRETYERLSTLYMKGQWEELEKEFATLKDTGFTPAQKADLTYMRKALDDGRPAWWKQAKAGKTFNFKPRVWTRAITASFDPASKNGVEINWGVTPTVNLKWPHADMDDAAAAEHGFSKGDLVHFQIWTTLGLADAWMAIPVQQQANLNEAGRMQLQRNLDFCANGTGLYFANPQSRRWGAWLFCASYMNKYASMPIVNSRKAWAAALMAEVLPKAEKYPSLTWPTDKDEFTEEKLALHLKDRIEKTPLTFAEDRALREAFLTFHGSNVAALLKSGRVNLPNGQQLALDPEQDKPLVAKRDAWVKAQLERIAAKAK